MRPDGSGRSLRVSLIQQALEKTGTTKPPAITLDTFLKKPTEKLPPKEPAAKPREKTGLHFRVNGLKMVLLALFVLIQTAVIYYFLVLPHLSDPKPQTAEPVKRLPGIQITASPQAAVAPTVSLLPKPKLAPAFVLSGISEAGADKFAVINNKVLAVGEEVSKNVTVIDILPGKKTVILQDEGRQISLKL